MELVRRIGHRIAPLIGVDGDDVHLGDSTTVSLFKTTAAARRLRPGDGSSCWSRRPSRPTAT